MKNENSRKARFKSNGRPGFSMTFENGWTISVVWHTSAYCERKSLSADIETIKDDKPAESADAEIAIWDSEGEWYDFGSDTVKGWCTPDEVAEWIIKVKQFNKQ